MKLRTMLIGVCCVAPVAAWLGCGSADNTDLTYGAADSGSGSDAAAASDTGDNGDSGNSGNDAGDSGSLPDGAIAADGGLNPLDAAPGGDTTQLACGAATCAIPSQNCCVEGTGGGRLYLCVVGQTCPVVVDGGGGNGPNVVALKCAAAANCTAGDVCCATVSDAGVASNCVPAGSCSGPGQHAQLCDPALTAGATGCEAGVTCTGNNDWGLPPTFGTCGTPGGPF